MVNIYMSSKKVGDNYKIIRSLGKGAFGTVYLTHANDDNYYASKVELRKDSSRLIEEYKIYRLLNKRGFKSGQGLPYIYSLIQTPKFNMMVMELLGPSLETLFNKCGKKFKLETVLLLAINLITLLERLHNAGFIHRDIKPANFLIGHAKNCDKIYMTDFGLAKNFIKSGKHIEYNTSRNLIGTLRYASINMHLGIEPSRRDDCESLGYMLIYFLKGTLPWQGLKKKRNEDQVQLIGDVKWCTSVDKLCDGLHNNFKKYIRLCRNLKFEERPDYDMLRDCFNEIAEELGIQLKYQWVPESLRDHAYSDDDNDDNDYND
jgi:serine/threonine protein kinase